MTTDAGTFECRDLHLRYVDKHGARTVITHRVWDAERFLAAQVAHTTKEGGRVEIATAAEATAARRAARRDQ